ncbi:MAG: tetratricopeptide repeat protein [Candidatus Cloacimonadota bacterium]|nr:MAG: tetratricopeptide repeat protein [Candidatus Cloacimonadota bacterium]
MSQRVEERRLITILFADISGFTALSANLDPEEVRDVANICFEYLSKPIIKESGTIHKYDGDLVIALFGFPVRHEDDPERAVKVSLEMMNLLPEINGTLSEKLRRQTELGLHIGINSGTVVVGEVGSQEKKDYTIMGDVVNLASRLKDTAKRGEILVSEPVFRASRYLFEYEPCEQVLIKGIEVPIKVFKPLRIKEEPESKRGIEGLHSPLVGRVQEFERLKQAVKRLGEGKGGVFFIMGDAGLGKSRLLEELKKSITKEQSPIFLLESRCELYGERIPYLPFLQMLGNIFGITNQDTRDTIEAKILKRTRNVLPDSWAEVVPYLGYLFAIRFADELDEKIKHLDAKDLKLQIFVSVKKLLTALSNRQPLLLVIEDYHWIDNASLELLEFIFDSTEPFPILFLGLSRIEKERECLRTKKRLKKRLGDNFGEIVLAPLDSSATTQLVYNLLNIPGITEGFKDRILAKAEGNPFYVEEIIRSLIDTNILTYSTGVWKLTSDISSLQIPDTVQAVIASRLDRLDKEIKDVLQMASVIGRNFYVRILERLCLLDSLMLSLYLATLEDFEYISALKRQPEVEYIFRHPLLQGVVYNGLLKKRRRELHRKVGEAIEEIYKDRTDDFAEQLAYQYANSDNIEKGLEWLKKAGQKAKERYANDEAIEYFQKIVSIIKEGIGGQKEELCAAYGALGDIHSLKGENERAITFYEEMYSNSGNDRKIQLQSRTKIANVYITLSRYDDALKILDEVEKKLSGGSQEVMLEKASIYIGKCGLYWLKGETEKALSQGEMGLNIIAKCLSGEMQKIDRERINMLRVKGLNNLGTIFSHKGEYDKAIGLYQKCLEVYKEADNKRGIGRVCNNLGNLYYVKGEYDKAIELYGNFLRISEEIGSKRGVGGVSCNLGVIYFIKGEIDRAIEHYQKFLEISEEIGDRQGVGMAYGNMGIGHYNKGEYDRAIEFAEKFQKISEEIGYQRGIGCASGDLGNVYRDRGEYAKATELYQKSLTIFEGISDKQKMGISNSSLGSLFLEIGELSKAKKYLLKSEEIAKELGDKYNLISVYTSLARLKNAGVKPTGSPDKDALSYADLAFKLAREIDSKSKTASCNFTYGGIYAAAEDFKKAEEYFKKAIKIFEELKEKTSLADTYLEYAKMMKRGAAKSVYSQDLADEYFNKARQIYRELKLPHKIKECS